MKKVAMAALTAIFLSAATAQAGEIDVLLTKLVEKNVLTPAEAQIIADETKLQVSKDLAQAKSLSVPEWTQRIKWGGDMRFRTQYDSGPGPGITDQRFRERIRGRFYMEGKANDFTYAGVRFSGGATGARSTNDTIGGSTGTAGVASQTSTTDYFQKYPVMFDQYYMRFEAPSEIVRDYGQYFSDAKLWLGRFSIPFEYSELVWDSDINPGGIALQYVSPDITTGFTPSSNAYGNFGMFWLDESATWKGDPIMYGYQVGLKTEPFGPFGTTMNLAAAFYDFANMKGKQSAGGAETNTRYWAGDIGESTQLSGAYRYEFNVFDLLLNIDNSKIMDIEFPHGLYGDFVVNPSVDTENRGLLLGSYVGKKKLKAPGDWKFRTEWRYIERDSVPDFMPDSDFYGFGRWTSMTNSLNAGNNGTPREGGTNGKGINMALEYQLFKNTSLNLEYYWMKPIKSWDKHEPWNEFQLDVITKF
ncbi:MAG: putative porin [Candidatus Omnitrophota bacterium]